MSFRSYIIFDGTGIFFMSNSHTTHNINTHASLEGHLPCFLCLKVSEHSVSTLSSTRTRSLGVHCWVIPPQASSSDRPLQSQMRSCSLNLFSFFFFSAHSPKLNFRNLNCSGAHLILILWLRSFCVQFLFMLSFIYTLATFFKSTRG